jgi:hypothetical protein
VKSDSLYALTQKCIFEYWDVHIFKLTAAPIQAAVPFGGMKLTHVARVEPSNGIMGALQDATQRMAHLPAMQVEIITKKAIEMLNLTKTRLLHNLAELEQEPQTEVVEIGDTL